MVTDVPSVERFEAEWAKSAVKEVLKELDYDQVQNLKMN
jgi:hypothetical protein